MISSPFSANLLREYIGLMKSLQHTTNLTPKEKDRFVELVETREGWFKHLAETRGLQVPTRVSVQDEWLSPLELILNNIPSLKEVEARIALKSMRRGTTTFLDQDIAKTIVDVLFKMLDVSTLEEEAIGGVYGH